jgi:hypothetical protein
MHLPCAAHQARYSLHRISLPAPGWLLNVGGIVSCRNTLRCAKLRRSYSTCSLSQVVVNPGQLSRKLRLYRPGVHTQPLTYQPQSLLIPRNPRAWDLPWFLRKNQAALLPARATWGSWCSTAALCFLSGNLRTCRSVQHRHPPQQRLQLPAPLPRPHCSRHYRPP